MPKLLQEHEPDIVLHMGLDEGRTFYGIESSASRDGYHQNLDIDRMVFNKAEAKKVWGSFPETLTTRLNLDDVLLRWQRVVKKGDVDVRVSDDVGDFVCGFIYYASLAAMGDERDVVFLRKYPLLHEFLQQLLPRTSRPDRRRVDVPPFKTKADIEKECMLLWS